MRANASILIIGDPGPAGEQILSRRDLETLWAGSAAEAKAILQQERPQICLVSPSIGRVGAQKALEVVYDHGGVPCVLLVRNDEPPIDSRVASQCVAIAPIDQVETILGLIGRYTSLRFARHARVPFEAPVRVFVYGEEHILETINIAVSGIAIKRFPRVFEGTLVKLTIELRNAPLRATARVVRYTSDGMAGLEFAEISDENRDRIGRLVQSKFARTQERRLAIEDLFTADLAPDDGANRALSTSDLSQPAPATADDASPEEIERLRRIMLEGDSAKEGAPVWLQQVASEITRLEGDAVLGLDMPAWVHASLHMRMRLARHRASREEKPTLQAEKIAQALSLEAYRLFVQLAEVARRENSDVVAQIARIRAVLLRDLLSGRAGADRSGANVSQTEESLEKLEAIDALGSLDAIKGLGRLAAV